MGAREAGDDGARGRWRGTGMYGWYGRFVRFA